MKKFIAVVLTLIMMLAVCVPAFASTTITDKTANTADAVLKTSTQKEDGTEGASYVVTFPAETIIPWEKTKTVFTYSVKSQLESGKRLAISVVSASGEKALVDANGVKLPYSFSKTNAGEAVDTLSYTTENEIVDMNRTFNIDIAAADWQKVPVNEYTGNLTFTVDVVNA